MFRRPSLGVAEISWRWSIGGAACALLGFAFLQYLKTLPVSNFDLLLLRSRQPVLVSQAITHIFHGSAPRLVVALIFTSIALAGLWLVTASIARVTTVTWVLQYFRSLCEERPDAGETYRRLKCFRSLAGLNFLRVAVMVASAIGCFGAAILAGFLSSPKDPHPGLVFLLFIPLMCLVWLLWSVLNWFLALASVFATRDGQDTFGSLSSAVRLCRERLGALFVVGFWFGLAHLAAFMAATSVVAFPLALAGAVPAGVVLGGVLFITLVYFAVVDFLYAGRMAGYVAIVEFPLPPAAVLAGTRPGPAPESFVATSTMAETLAAGESSQARVFDEDILCDVGQDNEGTLPSSGS
jgi:hypothetical protein